MSTSQLREEYFEGCIWEARNRCRGETPDLETYICMRDFTGAVKTCFDIGELTGTSALPIELRQHETILRMMQTANRVICWANDIFSVEKELLAATVTILSSCCSTKDVCSWKTRSSRPPVCTMKK